MKHTQQCLIILMLFVCTNVQAALPPKLAPPLDSLIIYSGAAITMGASSIVNGNIQVEAAATIGASSTVGGYIVAGAAVTLDASVQVAGYIEARDSGTIGANSTVGGHLTTGDAATLGATTIDGNIMIGGDLTAGAAILVGANAVILGNLRSGAAASANIGADAIVGGSATAGSALTLGTDVNVSGHAQAGTGAIALDVNAAVSGNARAGTSVTLAAGASVSGTITEQSIEKFANAPKDPVDNQTPQLEQMQADLAAIAAPAENQLPTSMTVSRTLTKGVFHTTALTTTAGITLTFDGENEDGHWLINSDSFIAFGASTIMILKNVTPNSTITWNAGSYTSTGESVKMIGTFFAGSYILTGASTTLKSVGDACGGLFTATGAVTLGASNIIGTLGCTVQPIEPLQCIAIAVSDKITIESSANIYQWNGNSAISTNSTASKKIKVKDSSTVHTDVLVGSGGNTTTVIEITGSGSITGSQSVQSSNEIIPSSIIAPNVGGNFGDVTYKNVSVTISNSFEADDLKITGNAIVYISGDVTLVTKKFKIEDTGQLILNQGASLKIYADKGFEFKDTAQANNGGDPANLMFYGTNKDIKIEDDSRVYARVETVNSKLEVKDEAQFRGGFKGREFKVKDSASVYADYNACDIPPPLTPIPMVAGKVTLNNTVDNPTFTHVCFDTPFEEVPIVFSLPTTANNSDRLALRIRNVTTDGFDIAQVESPEDANPNPPAGNLPQTVDFLAIAAGDYNLDGGAKMRVNTLQTLKFQGRQIAGASWQTVSTADLGFSQSPAIITSIQTMNNETNPFSISNPFLSTTVDKVSNTKFQIALERGETNSGTLNTPEIIGYIAISAGFNGQLTNSISYESFKTSNNVTGINSCRLFNLTDNYTDNPLVIASQNSRNGSDGGWLKRCSISTSSVGFSIVEDADRDNDNYHTNELAGGLALGGTFEDFTNTCANVKYYKIEHDGQGLTCESETVTIKACTDESCSNLSTEPVTLDFIANGTVINSPTFSESTTVSFDHTVVETLTFSLANATIPATSPFVCDDNSSNSCDMAFADAGFRFLSGTANNATIPNQIAGSVFNEVLKIQAVKNTNGVCSGLFIDNKNIALSQENVDPGGSSGLSFNVDNENIAKHSNVTPILLDFDADSMAIIPTPIYHDAGKIRLHANYDIDGITLSGSSNSFWVSPANLIISAKSGAINLNGASATATTTHPAGENFTLTVTAYNAASPAVITPNYSPGQIALKLTRTGPTLTDSVNGNLSYGASGTLATNTSAVFQDVTLNNFLLGSSTYNAAQYSEVGLVNLDVQDSNYGNASTIIPAEAINIGRFIPHHFSQTVADNGYFIATCNTGTTFAYSGQKDEATSSIGAISYLTNPVLAITAYNKQGNVTQNYFQDSQGSANDYMKLIANNVNITTPTLDQLARGINGNRIALTATMHPGTLSQVDLTQLPSVVALPKGVLHYRLSDDDHYFYNRSANALVAPFTSDIDFATTTIIDADSVNVTTTVDASPTGVEIRFGRLLLENSFGPETSDIKQPMKVQHFDGSAFITSLNNHCTGYNDNNISLTDISLDPTLTNAQGGTGNFIAGKTRDIELAAPGADNRGKIGVSYDAYEWLEYDWNNDGLYNNNPTAVATFGIFRGNDRIISWREVFN
ncbi:DUF6701 domain-containing protein [Colwellia hornerae]|nr:DUF6701 domain-containing protein [Colwellia hornerae]